MEKKVLENIKKHNLILAGDKVAVGVSGGADSVALLRCLKNLQFKLVAIHVNHNIRGENAKRDENFVKSLCNNLGVECIIKNVNALDYAKENKLTLEQSARILRYNAFKEVMLEKGCTKLAVAHNSDDQAETILMHLFRGTGIDGLIGMTFKNADIIRPLLNVSRQEIENYNAKQKISFIQDETNNDTKYVRNHIRHVILPKIEEVYPAVKHNLCGMGEKLLEIKEFINSNLNNDLIIVEKSGGVILKNTEKLSDFEVKYLIKECFNRLNCGVDIEEKHILMVKNLLNLQIGKKINLPNGVVVTKTYDGLCFENLAEFEFDKVNFKFPLSLVTPLGNLTINEVKSAKIGDGNLYADLDKIPREAMIRKLKRGDKISKFSGGSKLVSDFLTDKKIDSKTRKSLLVVAHDGDVLAIGGVEISEKVKLDENTKRVVKICLEK